MMDKLIVSITVAGLFGAYIVMLYAAAHIAVTIDQPYLASLAM
jgi:hypothetical protein